MATDKEFAYLLWIFVTLVCITRVDSKVLGTLDETSQLLHIPNGNSEVRLENRVRKMETDTVSCFGFNCISYVGYKRDKQKLTRQQKLQIEQNRLDRIKQEGLTSNPYRKKGVPPGQAYNPNGGMPRQNSGGMYRQNSGRFSRQNSGSSRNSY